MKNLVSKFRRSIGFVVVVAATVIGVNATNAIAAAGLTAKQEAAKAVSGATACIAPETRAATDNRAGATVTKTSPPPPPPIMASAKYARGASPDGAYATPALLVAPAYAAGKSGKALYA